MTKNSHKNHSLVLQFVHINNCRNVIIIINIDHFPLKIVEFNKINSLLAIQKS